MCTRKGFCTCFTKIVELVIYKNNMRGCTWRDLEVCGVIALDDYSTHEEKSSEPLRKKSCSKGIGKMT